MRAGKKTVVRIKVSTSFPEWPLEQQTPARRAQWGNCKFFINEPVDTCDAWIVFDDLVIAESCECPLDRTYLLTAEPPNVKTYNSQFVGQFATVLTAHEGLGGPASRTCPPLLPWHVGRHVRPNVVDYFDKTYDYLAALEPVKKTKLISVISSNKVFTDEHRYRRTFVEILRRALGDQLDVFGRGVNDIEDKWDAIAPYKYHLALENAAVPNYWTEKITDAYLGWAFPIYMGCPNLSIYFPKGSFAQLPWGDSEVAIEVIRSVLNDDPFQDAHEQLRVARQKCLDEYNFFGYFARLAEQERSHSKRAQKTLLPQRAFVQDTAKRPNLFQVLANRIKKRT